MLAWIKRTAVELGSGAALGFILWSLAGKGLTSMLFGSLGGSFSCRADVELALDKFLSMQLYSALLGALGVVVAMFFVRRRWSKAKQGTNAKLDANAKLEPPTAGGSVS